MMRPRHSDIFEAYAKLAEEKGLVKTAAEDKKSKKDKESPELKNYRSEVYPRVGGDDISTIEALYGVKPKASPGMDYDRNIVELAHPDPVVVGRSYDKLNALVENVNERQNIIINKILSRAPSGSSDMFLKDATSELTMQLVRIGNDMDNADEEELRILADECLEGLKKKADWMDDASDFAHKAVNYIGGNRGEKAVSDFGGVGEGALAGAATGALIGAVVTSWGGPLALGGAGVGALIGGAVGGIGGYIFNTSPKVKNIKENAADLLAQMNDLKKSVPEEASYFAEVESLADKLVKSSDNYLTAINIIRNKSIKNEPATPLEIEEVKKDTKEFIALIETFEKVRTIFQAKVKEGAFGKAVNSIPHPGVANDIEDVTDSFNSLAVAIDNLKATMSGVVAKTVNEAKKAAPETASAPIQDTNKEKLPEPENKEQESSFNEFWKMLGRKPDEKSLNFWNSLPENANK